MAAMGAELRIFLSSTSRDLEPYRAAAREVILDLGWHPVMMEHFGADGELGVVDACAARVAGADVVLAILAWKRGGVPGPERGGDGRRSYTRWEIDTAFRQGKPVLVLMADEEWPGRLWEDDGDARAAVRDFRGELDRLAVFFAWERDEGLPAFRAKMRQELVRHQERRLEGEGAAAGGALRPVEWPPPEFPQRPYPLLLPYEHPELLAGRDRELEELRRLLTLAPTVLGLYAPSGAGKSSVLQAGLVPALRAAGRPVAFDRHPHERGLAGRLIGDLLVSDGGGAHAVPAGDPRAFVELLSAARRLSGAAPLLVLDQLEDLLRPEAGAARAEVGPLLAASVQRQPGLSGGACRWLLAYRQEFHGEVVAWLGDVLREARDAGAGGVEALPHDLSGAERFHSWLLPPLGTPSPGADRLDEAAKVFAEAIGKPLRLEDESGGARYPWRFAGDGAERLAKAFGQARVDRRSAPLVPELQVVLAHLLEGAGESAGDDPVGIEVPDASGLIGEALENHLRRALEEAFPAGAGARRRRSRALLALRQLAGDGGRRGAAVPAGQLARAIGDDGTEILEKLASERARLVIKEEHPEGWRYALSHDRMAAVIVHFVEEEGRWGGLPVDGELLALRRRVTLQSELHRSRAPQATQLSGQEFRRIAEHAEALLWTEEQRQWWAACKARRRADRRRRAGGLIAALVALVLVAFGVNEIVQQTEERELLPQLESTDPVAAMKALDRLIAGERTSGEEIRERLRERGRLIDLFERGLAALPEDQRTAAVLQSVGVVQPLLVESPEDLASLGAVVWALDYFPGRDPSLAAEARALREAVLEPIRRLRPPPESPAVGNPDWIEVPGGSFEMGADESPYDDERPVHRVRVSPFRLQAHEVTLEDFRRLVPDHEQGQSPFISREQARQQAGEREMLVIPAADVSWYAAYAYAAWLGGRLPTEAEWEYAARASCKYEYCDRAGGEAELDQVGWYHRNSSRRLQPVKGLEPNPWGLYDMHGNAWEWVADWYGPYSAVKETDEESDPWGPPGGAGRVLRGGSAWYDAGDARSAYRRDRDPGIRFGNQGFRVLLPAAPSR